MRTCVCSCAWSASAPVLLSKKLHSNTKSQHLPPSSLECLHATVITLSTTAELHIFTKVINTPEVLPASSSAVLGCSNCTRCLSFRKNQSPAVHSTAGGAEYCACATTAQHTVRLSDPVAQAPPASHCSLLRHTFTHQFLSHAQHAAHGFVPRCYAALQCSAHANVGLLRNNSAAQQLVLPHNVWQPQKLCESCKAFLRRGQSFVWPRVLERPRQSFVGPRVLTFSTCRLLCTALQYLQAALLCTAVLHCSGRLPPALPPAACCCAACTCEAMLGAVAFILVEPHLAPAACRACITS